jgi:heterogeneous nuclear ribonucleoprotein U-like protein 1
VEYGKTFAKDDVVGCFADFETDGNVTLTYTVNGENQGPAFVLKKEDLENKALFPHILSKNCSFTVNLGQEDNWNNNILEGYALSNNNMLFKNKKKISLLYFLHTFIKVFKN